MHPGYEIAIDPTMVIGWTEHLNPYVPAAPALKLTMVCAGPSITGVCAAPPPPGATMTRSWSTPTSSLLKVTLTDAPADAARRDGTNLLSRAVMTIDVVSGGGGGGGGAVVTTVFVATGGGGGAGGCVGWAGTTGVSTSAGVAARAGVATSGDDGILDGAATDVRVAGTEEVDVGPPPLSAPPQAASATQARPIDRRRFTRVLSGGLYTKKGAGGAAPPAPKG
jgi:hypothetical protein